MEGLRGCINPWKKVWRRHALRQKWKTGVVESVHPWSRRKGILCHIEFSHGSHEMGVASYGELDRFIKPSSGDRVASVGGWEENEFSERLVSRAFSRQEVVWYGKMCIEPVSLSSNPRLPPTYVTVGELQFLHLLNGHILLLSWVLL